MLSIRDLSNPKSLGHMPQEGNLGVTALSSPGGSPRAAVLFMGQPGSVKEVGRRKNRRGAGGGGDHGGNLSSQMHFGGSWGVERKAPKSPEGAAERSPGYLAVQAGHSEPVSRRVRRKAW